MYEKGLLKLITPPCIEAFDDGDCDGYDATGEPHRHSVLDSRKDDEKGRYLDVRIGAYLPHSCDQWVIGGPDEIKLLIDDLNAALTALEV